MIHITDIHKIDLHMHTTASDGTDSPEELIHIIRSAGIDLFSVTDHDAILGCERIKEILKEEDLYFLSGIELSCKDEMGKYHILGYGYDADTPVIRDLVEKVHNMRITKCGKRISILKEMFGIVFSEEDIRLLYKNNNPGKPHLAEMIVKKGCAETRQQAFDNFLNKIHTPGFYISPEEAIDAILVSGGIPILAHPPFGSGNEKITGSEMDKRIRHLTAFGLQGIEGYYYTFDEKQCREMLDLAEKYEIYVTAGSDYHGGKKENKPGETKLKRLKDAPRGLIRFLEEVTYR